MLAVDLTLICEITANAAQDGPVQQIALEALSDQSAEDQVAGGGSVIEPVGQVVAPTGKCMELELTRKRKAEDFELQAKKDCKKVYNKAWYASNKDHKNAYAKAWRASNKDHKKAYAKVWFTANKEHAKTKTKAWCALNKGNSCSCSHHNEVALHVRMGFSCDH